MAWVVVCVALILAVWAFCSVSEAALYTVRRPYLRQIHEQGDRTGTLLLRFKDNMEQPITAILIVNTCASAAGAAYAGARIQLLFGDLALAWFSVAFTLAALFLSEILPKIVGVAYSRSIARVVAIPWSIGIVLTYPVIWIIGLLSRQLTPERVLSATEDEVEQMAHISAEEGSIHRYEAKLVSNALQLDRLTTRDIMTPLSVVRALPSTMSLREVFAHAEDFPFSRLPVLDGEDPNVWKGVVLTRDILANLARDRYETPVGEICSPVHFVSEQTAGHVLLQLFLMRRTHLFGVTDESGNITGVVTLEDVIESVIGAEIVDETDFAVDMQQLARQRHRERPSHVVDHDDKSESQEDSDD